MIPIPDNVHEIIPPIIVGTIVSLLNRFVLNNPNCTLCQQIVEFEQEMEEKQSDGSGNTTASCTEVQVHHITPHVHFEAIPHLTH